MCIHMYMYIYIYIYTYIHIIIRFDKQAELEERRQAPLRRVAEEAREAA